MLACTEYLIYRSLLYVVQHIDRYIWIKSSQNSQQYKKNMYNRTEFR